MRETIVFRPIQANLNKNKDILTQQDPYCKFKIGFHSIKSSVAKGQGKHPHWDDFITLDRKHGEQFAKITIKDKDTFSLDDTLGKVKINLDTIPGLGTTSQWINIYHRGKISGELLIQMEKIYH